MKFPDIDVNEDWHRCQFNIHGNFTDEEWESISKYVGDRIFYITSEDVEAYEEFSKKLSQIAISGKLLKDSKLDGTSYLVEIEGVSALICVESPVDIIIIEDTTPISCEEVAEALHYYRDSKKKFEANKLITAKLAVALGQDQNFARTGFAQAFLDGYLLAKGHVQKWRLSE